MRSSCLFLEDTHMPPSPNQKEKACQGAKWTSEITALKHCGSSYEAAVCLRRISDLLVSIEYSDRLKFCKPDLEASIYIIDKNKVVWNKELKSLAIELYNRFFNQNIFNKLSSDILQEIFLWLPVDDFAPVLSVCRDWHKIGSSDHIWKFYYNHRFIRFNPHSLPSIRGTYLQAFKSRLEDPHIGDKVEVAWRGKFRLEASDVYQGLAWWVAEVVDKQTSEGRYKIKYPGWDDRWDEWVPRSRLRWAVDKNTVVQICANDAVEIWCCGATVPGAWLESRVTKIRGDRYCVGNVLTSGDLWVERDRLRLIKHERNFDDNENAHDESQNDFHHIHAILSRSLALSRLSIGNRLSTGSNRSPAASPRSPLSTGRTSSDPNNCVVM